jgi:hypothetical protein
VPDCRSREAKRTRRPSQALGLPLPGAGIDVAGLISTFGEKGSCLSLYSLER